nr:uncharacterized protein LOC104096011 [Nicotiana tomentosiformis]
MPALPFPQKMKREKLDKYFGRFLEMLKKLYINIPFTELLTQMSSYAKFLKKIMSSKRKLEETIMDKLNSHCSSILQNKISQKCEDSGSFTIQCSFGSERFDKALFSLQLADQTTILPEGIIEDILVWVDKFVFPVDFIVVDMEVNKDVPLILGRTFLCTDRAILDIYEGKLMLGVGNEKMVFQIQRMMKYPSDESSTVEDEDPEIKKEAEALETEDRVDDEEELKEEASKPNVELKVLPTHLKYAFF